MTPTAEEQASTSTHLAGRTTYTTYTANTQQASTSTHLAGRSTQTTHTANTQLQSLGITTFKPGGLGPPTGGLHRRNTTSTQGGPIYLVIVIYIVSYIV